MKREYMYNMVFDKVVNEYLNPKAPHSVKKESSFNAVIH